MKHTTSENATRYIGIILIIISAVSFGAMPIFARVAYASGADPITVLFLRFGIAAVVMLGIMLASKTPFPRGPVLLIVLSDARRRVPASEGDVLGIMSLGCLMENMWLMAHSLGIGLQIMSVFSATSVEPEVKRMLAIPSYLKIAFAARLGYPSGQPSRYLRVRREVEEFTHQNRFGHKGLD